MILLEWLGKFVFWLLMPYWIYQSNYHWGRDGAWFYKVYRDVFYDPSCWVDTIKQLYFDRHTK